MYHQEIIVGGSTLKQFKKQPKIQLVFTVAIVCFSILLFFINNIERTPLYENDGRSFEKATVVRILADNTNSNGQHIGQQTVLLVLNTGKYKGTTVEAYSSSSYLYGAHCTAGMNVIASVNDTNGELYVNVYSFDRSGILYLIVLLFLNIKAYRLYGPPLSLPP